jgi:hypothetical protein
MSRDRSSEGKTALCIHCARCGRGPQRSRYKRHLLCRHAACFCAAAPGQRPPRAHSRNGAGTRLHGDNPCHKCHLCSRDAGVLISASVHSNTQVSQPCCDLHECLYISSWRVCQAPSPGSMHASGTAHAAGPLCPVVRPGRHYKCRHIAAGCTPIVGSTAPTLLLAGHRAPLGVRGVGAVCRASVTRAGLLGRRVAAAACGRHSRIRSEREGRRRCSYRTSPCRLRMPFTVPEARVVLAAARPRVGQQR